jgi:hypothetical protein
MKNEDYPKTRAEAKASGATHYFTGEPCKHGHIALRKTKGVCVECVKLETEKYREKRADYFTEYNKSDRGQEAKRKYYEANKEQVIARAAARPTKEKSAYKARYKEANPELYRALVSFRRRRFRDATPPWLNSEQKKAIRALYLHAQSMTEATGERYVVDHIIPLQSDIVCGLHVPWNLRVMTQEENLKKSNKLDTTPKT